METSCTKESHPSPDLAVFKGLGLLEIHANTFLNLILNKIEKILTSQLYSFSATLR